MREKKHFLPNNRGELFQAICYPFPAISSHFQPMFYHNVMCAKTKDAPVPPSSKRSKALSRGLRGDLLTWIFCLSREEGGICDSPWRRLRRLPRNLRQTMVCYGVLWCAMVLLSKVNKRPCTTHAYSRLICQRLIHLDQSVQVSESNHHFHDCPVSTQGGQGYV